VFFLNRLIDQEVGLYVYNMLNMTEKHFSISIAPVLSRGVQACTTKSDVSSIVVYIVVLFADMHFPITGSKLLI
jgi:hypothetical protein